MLVLIAALQIENPKFSQNTHLLFSAAFSNNPLPITFNFQNFNLPPTYLYHKDEQAQPGNFRSHISFYLLLPHHN
jgi:hypothetical protein